MKYWILVLLAGCAISQTTPADQPTAPTKPDRAASPPSSSQAVPVDEENARKAKALLDQMIQALGGPAYLAIQDISQQGRAYSFFHGQPNSRGTLFWRFYKYPDKDRIELTKQRDVVYVYSGDRGYEITYKGTAAEDRETMEDYLRRRAHSLDWVLRKWLKEPGIALFYEGSVVAADKPAEQVSILTASNDSVTLYIDTATHLPIKKTYSWRDPKDKLRNSEDEIYDNYRAVERIMTPFSVTRFLNGDMSNQRFLHEVSYNRGLSDSLFAASISYDPNQLPRKH